MLINIDKEQMQKSIEITKDMKSRYDNNKLPFNGMIINSAMLNNEFKLRIKITDIEKANELIKAVMFNDEVVDELKENGGIVFTEFEFAKKNIPEIDEIITKLEQLKMNL